MSQTVDAIYSNGVLRLAKPLVNFQDNTAVRVTVEAAAIRPGSVAECAGTLPDEDADEMRRIIEEEFEQVNLSEW